MSSQSAASVPTSTASVSSPSTAPVSSPPSTPPPQSSEQLTFSFRNFLEDFKNEDNESKFLKLGKEMVAYNGNVMHISMKDLYKHNQFLSEKVKSDYMGIYSSLASALRMFMLENIEKTSGKDFYLSFVD